jgi:hypothetical protein
MRGGFMRAWSVHMPRTSVDPASLEGEALRRWYLRTPDQIENERWAAADRNYETFFRPLADKGAAASAGAPQQAVASDEDVLWMADGRGGYRAVRPEGRGIFSDDVRGQSWPESLPDNPADPEAAEFVEIGNPHNRRLKQEYIKEHGSWPQTPDGRDYDVSHIRAIADGGTNTLDNIEPMHPDEHRAKHQRDGDNRRFGKRPGIARAFGAKVEPPAHAPKPARAPRLRLFGPLNAIPTITGILSGEIPLDNPENFTRRMFGIPTPEDIELYNEEVRKKYGDPII